MKKTLICALASLATPALAQAPAPVIDNERVTVRDIQLEPGKAGPAIQHAGDYVVLYVKGGQIRAADGKTAAHADGSAISGHGGSTSDTPTGGAAQNRFRARLLSRG